ncbi:hypothetical protein [Nocardia puris]|uniref:Uncharacterized protein n=1 Tax=Nocardia puris TaxID=208602 RepID=A0A366DMR3_9NOCA|nr:hypothetical protein [Nocardia puris]RBO91361.1 hypothetical protein DFR74_10463 [Nocardia puris]
MIALLYLGVGVALAAAYLAISWRDAQDSPPDSPTNLGGALVLLLAWPVIAVAALGLWIWYEVTE